MLELIKKHRLLINLCSVSLQSKIKLIITTYVMCVFLVLSVKTGEWTCTGYRADIYLAITIVRKYFFGLFACAFLFGFSLSWSLSEFDQYQRQLLLSSEHLF